MAQAAHGARTRTSAVSLPIFSSASRTVEHSRFGTSVSYDGEDTNVTTSEPLSTPGQTAMFRARELHALLLLIADDDGETLQALHKAERGSILSLAQRLANEVVMLTEAEDL